MLKIGEYIRTPYGKIGKITDIPKHNIYFDDGFILDNKHFIECGRNAMKEYNSTPKIIDLIQVGDYVNGIRVDEIKNGQLKTASYYDGYICHLCNDNEIKSIVTKEQFESIEYRIGE